MLSPIGKNLDTRIKPMIEYIPRSVSSSNRLGQNSGISLYLSFGWQTRLAATSCRTSFGTQCEIDIVILNSGCKRRFDTYSQPSVPSPSSTLIIETSSRFNYLKGAEWYNIFDRDDVLAWPLKPINKAYNEVVTEDVSIQVGGMLTGWNPLCHLDYWKDFDVISRVGDAIRETIEGEERETFV